LDVLGVVDASGVSGGRGGKEELWTMMVIFFGVTQYKSVEA
jgi:hypothetical protein